MKTFFESFLVFGSNVKRRAMENLTLLADAYLLAMMFYVAFMVGVKGFSWWFIMWITFIVILYHVFQTWITLMGRGYGVPVPRKRFTTKQSDGEVLISMEEIQEIILYLSDVEDYLERRGLRK